jgi:hypothetical protein
VDQIDLFGDVWSEWQDLNLRPPRPDEVRSQGALICFPPLESIRSHRGVTYRGLDVAVPEVGLQASGVPALVGELVAAGVAQHVRVYAERHVRSLTQSGHHLAKPRRRHGPATLRAKHMWSWWVLALEPTQGAKLAVAKVMGRGIAVFGPANTDRFPGKVDLIPLQIAKLAGPEAMPERHQNGRGVPVAPTGLLAGDRHQALDLALGQVFSRPLNCPTFRHGRRGLKHLKSPQFAGGFAINWGDFNRKRDSFRGVSDTTN